ncbi:MAG: hypothetical protein Q7S27_02435 [Nanoarchaeota archaeon]|nr:hypothetical protein [Nanoarchaeota archaeon]
MKLNFVFSEIYNKNLNRFNPIEDSWDKIKNRGEKFVEEYEQKCYEIINLIPKITKRSWNKLELNVYFVSWNGPNFSNPLTLRVRKDMLLMFVVLTHELIHNIMPEKGPSQELENEINNYVEEIFKELKINISDQIKIVRESSNKSYLPTAK